MKKIWIPLLYLGAAIMVMSCKSKNENKEVPADSTANVSTRMSKESFGKLPDGQEVSRFTLTNKNGIEMQVINYGGIITSLKVPDKNGVMKDIVLGYDSLSSYLKSSPFFGALIGRYGNRIGNGKFSLDGQAYTLAQNNNGQHLHGGEKGFDKVFWNIEQVKAPEGPGLRLTYVSKDMEEGYPGTLHVEVFYILTDNNELKIDYNASTDKKTIVNLTQHTYFNLTGDPKRDILGHELMLKADKFVPVDKTLIPTGELKAVANTPFDFNQPVKIGARINDKDQQLQFGQGYDHCWVLSSGDSMKFAASLYEPESGRLVEVYTTEPGIQFYSGNFLDGTLVGKDGIAYAHRTGLCLETEHFPDSPNKPQFPSVVLNPGEVYKTQTTYRFSVK
jgi:aldose 1-epimerase